MKRIGDKGLFLHLLSVSCRNRCLYLITLFVFSVSQKIKVSFGSSSLTSALTQSASVGIDWPLFSQVEHVESEFVGS